MDGPTKIAAVGQQRVPTIYTHTTLTNDTRHTQKSPIGSRREKIAVARTYLNALFTGTDATDLSDVEAAELNEIDSYPSYVKRMGACKESDIWRILYANSWPDDTYLFVSRHDKQVRFHSDAEFHDVRPYSKIHPRNPHNYRNNIWLEK